MKEIERQCYEHEIRCKLKLGFPLSRREESYYLFYMASHTERYEYIKSKKGVEKCNCNNKSQKQEYPVRILPN